VGVRILFCFHNFYYFFLGAHAKIWIPPTTLSWLNNFSTCNVRIFTSISDSSRMSNRHGPCKGSSSGIEGVEMETFCGTETQAMQTERWARIHNWQSFVSLILLIGLLLLYAGLVLMIITLVNVQYIGNVPLCFLKVEIGACRDNTCMNVRLKGAEAKASCRLLMGVLHLTYITFAYILIKRRPIDQKDDNNSHTLILVCWILILLTQQSKVDVVDPFLFFILEKLRMFSWLTVLFH
jgi:hypothetical protein